MITFLRFLHDDSIASNLTASAITGTAALVWAERRIVRHLRSLHRKHDQLVEQLRSPDGVVAPPEDS